MNEGAALIGAAAAAAAPATLVGGKGQQLGLLTRYGLPVPDFFVIPAAWSGQRARPRLRAASWWLKTIRSTVSSCR